VRARYAEVGRALEWLGGFGEARMTGTGACIFAAFDEDERAQAVLREVPPEWRGFVARGLNRSPLLDRV
jgi:4-diphosphocytidyl-2-C-methyl-D-erythritol kinase